MIKTANWINKNLGISRKTVQLYTRIYSDIIHPEIKKNVSNTNLIYSDDDIEKIWLIKLLIEVGYSHDEVKEFFDKKDNIKELLINKIEELETRKSELEHLIGFVKYVKVTGAIPEINSNSKVIKFNEYLKIVCDMFNAEYVKRLDDMSNLNKKINSLSLTAKFDAEDNEDPLLNFSNKFIESMGQSNDGSLNYMVAIQKFRYRIFENKYKGYKSEEIQQIIKEIYEYEKEFVFYEIDNLTIEEFVMYHLLDYKDSEVAEINEKTLGKDFCLFMIDALRYFEENNAN